MQTLPPAMITLLAPCAPLFSCRVWRHALVLVAGALLARGKRTVCAALRAMGHHQMALTDREAAVTHPQVLLPAAPLTVGDPLPSCAGLGDR